MLYGMIPLIAGFLLDLLLGDPRWLYHPVCLIGNLISFLEKRIRAWFPKTPKGERLGGLLEVFLVCILTAGIPFLILFLLYRYFPPAGLILETFWCYQLLAVKSLKTESMKVYDKLKEGNLEGSRKAVSMIVGRDTQNLDETQVAKATVETIAENTSDGIVAPMFYMALGGVWLMFLYKGINTMDSMLGYKNEKYINFGRYAARLDDIANYIPARISAWLMIAASGLLSMNRKNAVKIYLRDRYQHASPNSAHTEAVAAGALEIQLAGNAWYFGKLYENPPIGDPIRKVEEEDIPRTNRLLYGTSVLGVIVFSILRLLIWTAMTGRLG